MPKKFFLSLAAFLLDLYLLINLVDFSNQPKNFLIFSLLLFANFIIFFWFEGREFYDFFSNIFTALFQEIFR